MQQAPTRLSQTIRSAFRAARPVHRLVPPPRVHVCAPQRPSELWFRQRPLLSVQARHYSDKKTEVDRKIEHAKSRIDDALESRVDAAAQPDTELKDPQHETIVHTNPEASSIVYTSSSHHGSKELPPNSPKYSEALPSQSSLQNSQLRKQFTNFMDNFQSHIFTASQRLNDLTGYSGIEALKKQIEAQENLVQSSRRAVKDARAAYADAIATRSTTQREVNDLLHRKHAWSPADLERFTSLYRSDHANEQAEMAAQKDVSEAEARYEESSTRLARTILARYHEEQIWSDKIRQMSTWGTWGLMGLNVLLFVVFQIAVEPWRRRRLVKGFEEKVELALKERDSDVFKASNPTAAAAAAAAAVLGQEVSIDQAADSVAEQIVDAVSGTSPPPQQASAAPTQASIEAAAESLTASELAQEFPSEPANSFATAATGYAYYEEAFRELFSDKTVLVTQRELTTVALEGAAGGAALMGLLFVLLRPR